MAMTKTNSMNDILYKSLLLDFYGMLLTDKQRTIYELKYNDDLSLSEIASELSISRQAASDAIKTATKTLNDYESKLNLVERFERLSSIIDNLDNKLNNKDDKNITSKDINQIKKELEKIRKMNNGI
ncbi:MAG: YlxM family DNA-binding protein [Clostridia bacterium]|nr:YlxM family DNA-binding protein [Clostridia bacterium]